MRTNAKSMVSRLALAAALASPGALAGCGGGEADTPEAKIAEQAVGISPKSDKTKTVEANRDVSVVEDTKVIDNTTGQVLSETTKTTPVKITQEKSTQTNVKVDVGDSAAAKAAKK